jgi:TRAP-type C4-dicarboxylate transport system substrate-binding protein
MKSYWRKYKVMAILACVSLLIMAMSGPGETANRKVIKLRMAAGHPYAAGSWVRVLEDFFIPEVEKRVFERTKDYKVEIKGFYGGSLAKPGEVLESIESGRVDIGFICLVFELAKFEPHNFCWWCPFTSPDVPQVIRAYEKVIEQFPLFKEIFGKYNQRQVGNALPSLTNYELITNFPVKTLEDLKGKKIAHGGAMIPWLKALGAVGIRSTFNEAYTSIDTGVYQGWAMPVDVAMMFKIHEVAPYTTLVGFGASVVGFVNINLDTWKKLPPEVQQILDEVGSEYTWELYKLNEEIKGSALKTMKKAGSKIYTLPQVERTRWAKVLSEAAVARKAVQKTDAHGYPGTAILKAYIKALEEEGYTFPFPPKL